MGGGQGSQEMTTINLVAYKKAMRPSQAAGMRHQETFLPTAVHPLP